MQINILNVFFDVSLVSIAISMFLISTCESTYLMVSSVAQFQLYFSFLDVLFVCIQICIDFLKLV